MSQAGVIAVNSGNLPPNVPTTFQGQNSGVNDGSAVPAANIINFNATYVTTNNLSGFEITASGNTVTYELTNRYQTSQNFSDAAAHNIYTQALGATPGVYLFEFTLIAFNSTSSLGAAYKVEVPIRTDGATATGIVQQNIYLAEEGAMSGVTVSAGKLAPNSFFVSVQGYNTDTIKYNLTGSYTFVS